MDGAALCVASSDETALIRFQHASHLSVQSLKEWAERLHNLAVYAFEADSGTGMYKHQIKQVVLKFCTDRAAYLHAANMHTESG
ncbi:hypothetical protein PoB_002483300 [Plakobranchus ocellatus]|uniref:PH domain-containing protein n=1 Tax=Plakobranchus ocellatus TaxID=259542 RepID=A0AAV3ZTZ0_9GAST|nr:hypothetical protein PoB_002483300 [Plakobranchus ocellatus]